jgi:Peptidase family M28
MASEGWDQLLEEPNWARGPGKFPIAPYSEFMPGHWVGIKPYGTQPRRVRDDNDPYGWLVSEYEQAFELRPGMEVIAREILKEVTRLGEGRQAPQIGRNHLRDNPYWPEQLDSAAGKLPHERYLILAAVALSRTKDDKGRIRWTLFGSSDLGPAAAFWQGFRLDPVRERPAEEGLAFFRQILREVFGVQTGLDDLARAGFAILPLGKQNLYPQVEEAIPSWCQPFIWDARKPLGDIRYLLTFRAFSHLPEKVQRAYLEGKLHLLPFPGSLVFWGSTHFRQLIRSYPLAIQTPLLNLFPRYNAAHGMRIPQAGWVDFQPQAGPDHDHAPHRHHYIRTNRWQRLRRDQEETEHLEGGDHIAHVLFSTEPNDLGLYDKPMARNAQLWTHEYRPLLDGPRATRPDLYKAARLIEEGGRFGYRFVFPAMRVGPWEVYWHRPVAAYPGPTPEKPALLSGAPTGFISALRADDRSSPRRAALWPRLLARPIQQEAVELFIEQRQPRWYSEALNIRALIEFGDYFKPAPLPVAFALRLMMKVKGQGFDAWLAGLPEHATDQSRAEKLASEVRGLVAADQTTTADPAHDLTFSASMNRSFETDYWTTIADLAHGTYQNKDNADCFQDEPTAKALKSLGRRLERDLDSFGDYLIQRHDQAIKASGLAGSAWVGEHAFGWETDFEFQRWGAWLKNQEGTVRERNIIVRIPGKDSSQAVIMADHYDTAYMYDLYEAKAGGSGARVAACGADDNHSATAALLLAAPIFLKLSKEGRLACDIWLVHLTGEEFPSDCLGARNLCQALVEGNLKVIEKGGSAHDLGQVTCRGVYVADMIAHNNVHARDVFQIAPGEGKASAWLAYQAHIANRHWNDRVKEANKQEPRHGANPFVRSIDPKKIPALCPYLEVTGQVRPDWDPRSTLYNTDGLIFSDAGVPVVLFMENYDIDRSGYHDTHDTMENIDLDYGSAVAAIFIESVARAASRVPMEF